jgi:hypothetical protein
MFFDFRPCRAFRLPVIKMPMIGLADAPGPTHAATPMSNNVIIMSYRLSAFAHMHQLILLRGNLAGLGQPVGSSSPKSGAIPPRYSESCE